MLVSPSTHSGSCSPGPVFGSTDESRDANIRPLLRAHGAQNTDVTPDIVRVRFTMVWLGSYIPSHEYTLPEMFDSEVAKW